MGDVKLQNGAPLCSLCILAEGETWSLLSSTPSPSLQPLKPVSPAQGTPRTGLTSSLKRDTPGDPALLPWRTERSLLRPPEKTSREFSPDFVSRSNLEDYAKVQQTIAVLQQFLPLSQKPNDPDSPSQADMLIWKKILQQDPTFQDSFQTWHPLLQATFENNPDDKEFIQCFGNMIDAVYRPYISYEHRVNLPVLLDNSISKDDHEAAARVGQEWTDSDLYQTTAPLLPHDLIHIPFTKREEKLLISALTHFEAPLFASYLPGRSVQDCYSFIKDQKTNKPDSNGLFMEIPPHRTPDRTSVSGISLLERRETERRIFNDAHHLSAIYRSALNRIAPSTLPFH